MSLTGSERAGAAVAEIAGRNLKKVVLELGGSDPFIVLRPPTISTPPSTPPVDGRFENTGQSCNAAKRIIVAESVYDDFLDKFIKKVREKADGLAPLSSVAAAERLDDQVKRAVADGATLVSEGERNGAFFPRGYSPTFPGPATARSCSDPSRRSTGWPTRTPRSNWPTTPRSDWVRTSTPPTTTRPSASRTCIEAGMVFVNAVGAEGVELPFGGVKRSGFGRELGRFGIDEFVNKKLIRIG